MLLIRSVPLMVSMLLLLPAASARAQGWTPWLVDNTTGTVRDINLMPNHLITGIEVREQAGFGIVNLRVRYTDKTNGQKGVTNWACRGSAGERKLQDLPNGMHLRGAAVGVQNGHGIIELQMQYANNGKIQTGPPITNNRNVQRWFNEFVQQNGRPIRAVQIREQAGFGIVDIRFGY